MSTVVESGWSEVSFEPGRRVLWEDEVVVEADGGKHRRWSGAVGSEAAGSEAAGS